MQWLSELPDACDQFTLTGGDAGERTVQVIETSLPQVATTGRG